MRAFRPAPEFRVELAGRKPGVIAQLDDLDQAAVRGLTGLDHARRFQHGAVLVVDLEAMAMGQPTISKTRPCLSRQSTRPKRRLPFPGRL